MNAHVALSAYTSVSYAAGSYVMGLSDFPNGCALRTDAVSGRQWAFGRNKLGLLVQVPLNVPLCGGCDRPIVQHICPDCCQVFLGDPRELVA